MRLLTPLGKTCVALSFLTRCQLTGRLAAEWLSWPLTLLLVTPSLCTPRPAQPVLQCKESLMGHPSLPEGLLSVGDLLLGVVPALLRAPHS